MMKETYDIITVGGGLGGAALAKVMAESGARVLVLERERQFRDRVRGEVIVPWGVVEAKTLGIYPLLQETGGYELRWSDFYIGQDQLTHRDLATTTPQRAGEFSFSHPAMQEVVLQAAADAGAEVRRGVAVRQVQAGAAPTVVVEHEGSRQKIQVRLVVGADGRGSMVRKWTGFSVRQDPPRMLIAGVMFDTMPAPPEDTLHIAINPTKGRVAYLFPQGQGRVRAYTSYHQAVDSHRLQGEADIPRFVEECVTTGIPAEWYAGVRAIGPLATFDGADTWVEHPYTDGVALIGDAATASDPTWGQGLPLTLRDVRVLRDCLLNDEDWTAAGHAYAAEHDRYYSVIHTVDNWWTDFFVEYGPQAEARRARALPLIAQDESRVPDHVFCGPELPLDDTVRQRFFGEE